MPVLSEMSHQTNFSPAIIEHLASSKPLIHLPSSVINRVPSRSRLFDPFITALQPQDAVNTANAQRTYKLHLIE